MKTTNIPDIVKSVKKRVAILLITYFSIIAVSVTLPVALIAIFLVLLYNTGLTLRAIILMISLLVGAFTLVAMVLKPLFAIFSNRRNAGTEIFRNDAPDLFAMIDEIVAKVGCKYPVHVYVSNEVNAFVNATSLWGSLLNKGLTLTIGLPMLTVMNRSELKSVLSHEFGHFTQDSVKTNRIANLSEYICASISYSHQELGDSGFLAVFVTKIMNKQYRLLAPLNGTLSRAQEFNADTFSQGIAGSDTAISLLCKFGYLAHLWEHIIGFVTDMMVNEKIKPAEMKTVVDMFVSNSQMLCGCNLCPSSILSTPMKEIENRFSWVNNDTHPSFEDRCEAIKQLPYLRSDVDIKPALEMFSKTITKKIFNSIITDLQSKLFENQTVFMKADISDDELRRRIGSQTPLYLDNFFNAPVFFANTSDDAVTNTDKRSMVKVPFPFTEENGHILLQYYTAYDELSILNDIANKNDSKVTFYYNERLFNGRNVPLQEHNEYISSLYDKVVRIACDSNRWISEKLGSDKLRFCYTTLIDIGPSYEFLLSLGQDLRMLSYLWSNLYDDENMHNSPVEIDRGQLKKNILNFDTTLREGVKDLFKLLSDGKTAFRHISERLDIQEKHIAEIEYYFSQGACDNGLIISKAYWNLLNVLKLEHAKVWSLLKQELIIPAIAMQESIND